MSSPRFLLIVAMYTINAVALLKNYNYWYPFSLQILTNIFQHNEINYKLNENIWMNNIKKKCLERFIWMIYLKSLNVITNIYLKC